MKRFFIGIFLLLLVSACSTISNVSIEESIPYNFEFLVNDWMDYHDVYFEVIITDKNGELVQSGEAFIEVDMPGMNHNYVVNLYPDGEGVFKQNFSLPMKGNWLGNFLYIHNYESYSSERFTFEAK